jgi:hypothetical protein
MYLFMMLCTTCHVEKPGEEYYYRNDRQSLRLQCKKCVIAKRDKMPTKGELVYCLCGCRTQIYNNDKRGRPRRFLQGHWQDHQGKFQSVLKQQHVPKQVRTELLQIPMTTPYHMRQYLTYLT